jgi:hypothetical protein
MLLILKKSEIPLSSHSLKRAIFNFYQKKNIILIREVEPFNKPKSQLLFDLVKS